MRGTQRPVSRTEREKITIPGATLPDCAVCHAPAVVPSGVYGLREQLLFLLGATFHRCRNCEARHAHLGRWTVRLADPHKTVDKTPYLVAAAIVIGLMACIGVALWTLRRTHRWPF